MTRILLLLSSPRGEAAYSSRVARRLAEQLQSRHRGATLQVRDLAAEPLPYLAEEFVAGLGASPESRSPAQAAAIERSDRLVEELLAADIVVIGTAMINFGVSAPLKSWIDHIARAGLTFRYSAEGIPEGLVKGKKVFLVAARGGQYAQEPQRGMDFQVPYLKAALGFLGMTDLEVIAIEGTAFGPEVAEQALQQALERVQGVTAAAA